MKNLNININLTTLVIIAILLITVFGGFGYLFNENSKLKDELQQERNLTAALNDSLRTSINRYGEVVTEKRTLQTTISRLEELNDKLTVDQRNLLRKLQASDKDKSIFAAALIRANIVIDSLLHHGDVLIGDSTVTFIESKDPDLQYIITVGDVMPISLNVTPTLMFNNLNIPNEMYINFFWKDDKRDGYPISFSVTNTNRFMKIHNIESYVIPSIKKEELDPNNWQKFTKWLEGSPNRNLVIGGAVGLTAGYFIFK